MVAQLQVERQQEMLVEARSVDAAVHLFPPFIYFYILLFIYLFRVLTLFMYFPLFMYFYILSFIYLFRVLS